MASQSSSHREIKFSEDLMRPLLISLVVAVVLAGSHALGADDGDKDVNASYGTK